MNSSTNSKILFRPLLVAGIIIIAFGITCILIGATLNLKEESAGFTIIGWRFLISGIVSIILAYIAKYFEFISFYTRYVLKQIRYWRNPKENRFNDWYKP
jgi:membrane-bound ClpP family serine protease